jgi:hypothetical protein
MAQGISLCRVDGRAVSSVCSNGAAAPRASLETPVLTIDYAVKGPATGRAGRRNPLTTLRVLLDAVSTA